MRGLLAVPAAGLILSLLGWAGAPSRAATAAGTSAGKSRELVEQFFREVFFQRNVDAASKYLRTDYIQHNPHVPTGLAGFQAYFRRQFADESPAERAKVRYEVLHTLVDGDLVAIHLRATWPGQGRRMQEQTWFDLFRIQDGLIAEHWDAIHPPDSP